ncbi:hypothetical protein VB774_19310 [Pseudanabaena galeata UHCC 0370]|uniref:Uncharacterized protein n=1 Tax=Pseudanabaena galeata UHCC 0370 TaxID=3110310 RepID=A0ABU5TP81_9CYAN|nr:hypothetical protein [Pseudanabaena galeata]MEA5479778.1 hypothetical protein [Pseudanabaena galeata UHCC 0370]
MNRNLFSHVFLIDSANLILTFGIKLIAYSPPQTAIAPSSPTNPIAYSPHQTAIATHHPQNPIAYSLHQTAIAPTPTTKPDRLNLNTKQRSPLIPHRTRSPKSQHQTAIAICKSRP